MKISLIIPMYNESSIVSDAVMTFSGYLSKTFEDWELIFVDDGSTDGCGDAVLSYGKADDRVKLVRYTENQGKGYAVRTGMLAASGDIRIFTDCDNAYGTDVIEAAVKAFESTGADVLVGSRNLHKDGYEGYTFIRKLASKMYIKVISVAAGFRLSDSQCGFKGFTSSAAESIFKYCTVNRWAFDLEAIMIANKYNYKITEIPVKIINHRESKIHVLSDSFKMLGDVARLKKRVKKLDIGK